MDRQSATRLLNETFNNNFELEKFTKFITELFNEFTVNERTWNVWKEYQDYIDSYRLLGSYKDNSRKVIDVLVIKLKRTSSRDRARTMQRNFVAKYLGNAQKDAALVAFYGDDPEDWRFSFVKMEYNLVKDKSGKVKPVKELTPAKRYSFLVGVNEPNHTCRSQFLKLVMEEEINPSLSEIEQAFSIDNVTKEFFKKYKELFLELKESLEKVLKKDKNVRREFEEKNISTVDFAKKLLGQIVFIYFLQKKGWLGVKKNPKEGFAKWGSGPKDFLRKLFDKEIVPYDNFFNDILEPLFYEALATERDDDYYSRFNCKIPFLNGGLFEPINDYNWAETDIVLDNSIFERILSTFDRFNFTVKEDEPLEKEVAVDPEMLGKVFENLLEIKDRKSKGAFYTPREIVHYMCQQSLINYLETNTSISRKDIEKFIQMGDVALDQTIKAQEQKKKYHGKTFDIDESLVIPKSIERNYEEIDELLKKIKIVDPACGSGAFLIGMLNEIIKARSILAVFSNKDQNIYDTKREIIENCLYGVDIESSAVEISKLRFWLSLVVDEMDMKNIKPLPNLDHKIMCGNSLLDEFEGVKLFDERLLGEVKKDVSFEVKQIEKELKEVYKKKGYIARGKLNGVSIKDVEKEIKKLENKKKKILSAPKSTTRDLTLNEAMQHKIKESQIKLKELRRLQKQYFNEQNKKIKRQLREEIDRIEWELIETTLKEQGNEEALKKLEQYKKSKAKPFFLWKLYFAEVFQRENQGFDVVISNPPYIHIRTKSFDRSYIDIFKENYKLAVGQFDLFALFTEKAYYLLRKNGTYSFIIPKRVLSNQNYKTIREFYYTKLPIIGYLDAKMPFETASVEANVLIAKKQFDSKKIKLYEYTPAKNIIFKGCIDKELAEHMPFKIFPFTLNKNKIKLLVKIAKVSYRLGELLDIARGYEFGFNHPSISNKKTKYKMIKGGNIYKYYIKFNNFYLEKSKLKRKKLKNERIFKIPKLVTKFVSNNLIFAYDDIGYYNTNVVYNCRLSSNKIKLKCLLGILNSKCLNFWFKNSFLNEDELFPHIQKNQLEEIPIKKINNVHQLKIIDLVNQILSITKSKDYLDNPDKQAKVKKLEKEIDLLVYKLYELTPEEIKIVEEFHND